MNSRDEGEPALARGRVADQMAELRARRERMAAELAERDRVGDSADDADALERGDALAVVDDRIAELGAWLEGDRSTTGTADTLPVGTELSLRFADTTVTGVRIVSITEEIAGGDETTVTADSPLGLALAGHRPGDTVIYTTPRGPQRVQLLSLTLPAETPEGPADR
ncbi:GreA/GreB family elongation factor [Rhodococcus koreensis]